jgi:hypothetical protein
MENETLHDLQILLAAVLEMRMNQRNYFRSRLEIDKLKSMRNENDVDRICLRYKMKGYRPEQIKSDPPPKLF